MERRAGKKRNPGFQKMNARRTNSIGLAPRIASPTYFVVLICLLLGGARGFLTPVCSQQSFSQKYAISSSSNSLPESSAGPLGETVSSSAPSWLENAPSFRQDDADEKDTTRRVRLKSNFSETDLLYQPNANGNGDPLSTQSFNMDLHNLAANDPQQGQDALEIMNEMYRKQPDSPWTVQPDVSCYRTVLDGWIDNDNLEKAQATLDLMEEKLYPHGSLTNSGDNATRMISNEMIYLSMIQGWADDTKDDFAGKSAERAEALLRRMKDRVGVEPNVKLWTMVLEGWCKRAGIVRGAMTRAEALLNEMESHSIKGDNSTTSLRPNVLTYTSYIGGLARCKDQDKARRAEAVLDRMERFGVQSDMVAMTSVINCWAKATSRRERELSAVRALRILSEMERMYISNQMYHVKPSLITYTATIGAIGNSLDPAAPKMALDLLKRMYTLQESGAIANMKPTTNTYNAVIYALSRAPRRNRLRCAKRAEQLLAEMLKRYNDGEHDVQPDVRTWAALLRAWARSGSPDAAENAQRVLDRLEKLHENEETPVRPNYVCYTTVMGAWGHSTKKGSLDKMEEILKTMEQRYEETLEADIRPNTISYVTAIDAFVRRNEKGAVQRAQATVDRMITLYSKGLGHVRPTRIVFNTLIHAWSKSKARDAAQKAERIFRWMETQYRSGDELVRPDEVSLCAVLNAWANQAAYGGSERAQQIWEYTESISVEERGFPLTIMMPNIVIKAIARSKDPKAHEKAERVLLQLEADYDTGKRALRPDVTTFSSVINACAYYSSGNLKGRSQALETALRTFRKLHALEDEQANNITYGTVFKAIANLMPVGDERDALSREIFDQCTDEGLVDSFVLSQVRNANPQLYRELVEEPCGLGGPEDDCSIEGVLENIPREWSTNVID